MVNDGEQEQDEPAWDEAGVTDIPADYPPNETPAEALEDILRSTIDMAKEMGAMTDDEVNAVLEKLLEERLTERRKSTFKIHRRES